MTRFDLSPLYRSTVGFDRFGSLLDAALQSEQSHNNYPPYNIEAYEDNRYSISVAVAGFDEKDLDIQVDKGVLTVKGTRPETQDHSEYLYRGIATRSFERKFTLADHVEVTGARIEKGLLVIDLVKEIPETLKPRTIAISSGNTLENKAA
jgi:molecular chaperone IbpA